MTVPAFIFGVLFSTLLGAVFHLVCGGGFGRIVLYIFLSWIGFWLGHVLGNSLDWTFWSVGPLRMGMASLGSLFFLLIGLVLSLLASRSRDNNQQD